MINEVQAILDGKQIPMLGNAHAKRVSQPSRSPNRIPHLLQRCTKTALAPGLSSRSQMTCSETLTSEPNTLASPCPLATESDI